MRNDIEKVSQLPNINRDLDTTSQVVYYEHLKEITSPYLNISINQSARNKKQKEEKRYAEMGSIAPKPIPFPSKNLSRENSDSRKQNSPKSSRADLQLNHFLA